MRLNTNNGAFFGYNTQREIRGDGRTWLNTANGGPPILIHHEPAKDASFLLALASPKTTDILAISAERRDGLESYDWRQLPKATRHRAIWYSAATILQRAIALRLDVDSMDIEIASVHALPEGKGEVYLADAHANGAGIVAWARDHWTDLLTDCIKPSGTFGKLVVEEVRAHQEGQEWRSPDRLLKGFRNRHLHGLLDCELGMDLLRVLEDPSYAPGFDDAFQFKARHLSESYCKAFQGAGEPMHSSEAVGWKTGDTFVGVVHPLWSDEAGTLNRIGAIHQLAANSECTKVRLVDTFNLSRRMAWVRARLLEEDGGFPQFELFGVLTPPLTPSNTRAPSPPSPRNIPSKTEVMSMPEGTTFQWDGMEWERCPNRRLDDLSGESAAWLATQEDIDGVYRLQVTAGGQNARMKRIGIDSDHRRAQELNQVKITILARKKEG